ncbi:hypothetical protein HMPREF9700_00174 [Bergeyella zoohelcum CCUG 30536]|uniref:Uncharacterized protein n=2 Tax=Bergeyella zoohelcum TaxID=1015 RepID=A0A376C0G6_9FLAO|nr:hypothetical protein HMPREF9700_00174 [Bergeyella zoohelcum CCUG 30536]SSZ47231.1 Uncharacterised protein [Bergeyella zoohelcum]
MFFVLLLLVIFIIYSIFKGGVLKRETRYLITNEWNEPIPAKVYSRIVKSEINGEKEEIYQILIFFDNKNTYNPVLIIPKYSVIGIVEGGRGEFWNFNGIMFQKSKKSNEYTSLTNILVFDDSPPIVYISFETNKIIFNTFGNLTEYGQKIILNKR